MFHNVGRKAVRAAASVIVLGLLGSLAGCGGGGGGGDTTTPPPDNTPTLQSIEITPSLTKAAAGTTAQFTATGVYTDNSTEDLTAQATWASSDSAVAMVSNAAGSKGVAITTGVGSATVSATSGDVSGDTMLTVTDATLVSIEVSPAAPSYRERFDAAVHGDRSLLGQLDAGPHDAGHLGLVQRRGGDSERRRRLEWPGDRGRRRQHHRVCDQRTV